MRVFKRRLKPCQWLAPGQMLELLGGLQLTALAADGAVLLAADRVVAWALEQSCTGAAARCLAPALAAALPLNAAPEELRGRAALLQATLHNTQRRKRRPPPQQPEPQPEQQQQQQQQQPEQQQQQQQPGPAPEAAAPPGVVYLRLTLEEAVFLQWALGCCAVCVLPPAPPRPEQQQQQQQQQQHGALQPLDDQGLWEWCVRASGQGGAFAATYAAYHHFRSKGWLPRAGGLYGAHYVLYRAHPGVCHSEFVALVVHDVEGGQGRDGGQQPLLLGTAAVGGARGGTQPLTWLDVGILQRLAHQVFKKLLLVYVGQPPGRAAAGPGDLGDMSVREVLVSRWTPAASGGGAGGGGGGGK